MVPEFKNSSYSYIWREHLGSLDDYKIMLNWMSDEFTLYQQDYGDGLKVNFPNGYFFIYLTQTTIAEFEINIHSKCNKSLVKTYNNICTVVNHFKNYKECKFKEGVVCK